MRKKEKREVLLLVSGGIFVLALIGVVAYYFFSYLPYVKAYENSFLDCKTLEVNDENGINLVFFSSKEQTEEYSNYLFSVEPLNELKNKFNIYYIDNYHATCDIYKGVAILCYSKNLLRKAASCPNDYVIVLEENEDDIRSSSYLNVMSINTKHPLSVMVHEFGHSFANLAEEYIPAKIPRGSENCQAECTDFEAETNGCFEECSDASYYRSINAGVMRTLSTKQFGVFNEKLVMDSFDEQYKGSDSGLTGRIIDDKDDCSDKVYYEAILNDKGEVIGKSKQVGCAPPPLEDGKFDPNLIFTDGWKKEENVEIPGEQTIVGETFLPEGIEPVIAFTSEDLDEERTTEIEVTTREETREGIIEDSKNVEVDFNAVPEPSVFKKKGFIEYSAGELKGAIDVINPGLAPTSEGKPIERTILPEGSKFIVIRNESNKTDENYTIENFRNETEGNETNSSGKFGGFGSGTLTGNAALELGDFDEGYLIAAIIALILTVLIVWRRSR